MAQSRVPWRRGCAASRTRRLRQFIVALARCGDFYSPPAAGTWHGKGFKGGVCFFCVLVFFVAFLYFHFLFLFAAFFFGFISFIF
jgi:hypothetical protein